MLIPMLIIGRHFLLRQSIHQVALHSFFVISIPLILACLYAFVIFEQNESSYSFFKMKSFKKASFLGKISYGMYAYHMIAFSLVLTFFWKVGVSIKYDSWCQWLVFSGVAFALTLILALFSYFFIERFFLKYKPT
jgi:peptidoglycan/LPS O-acetylase OafA/YrhL